MNKNIEIEFHPDGRPLGMSIGTWKKMHRILAAIHLNHLDEVMEMQKRRGNDNG
ncbi:hypothetical protein GNQ08_21305 [Paenibacillus macerans]|uniref:Uncharacterized protein n=1 Tax=Paenibacillus macerans TaxID=44252 RepID=A0A6N8EZ00_PAEMA|nr:hypothetical protein [Paenibacillus macerans]MEC0329354.1 hypothetical protein [Paenibacillus macerans]MUG24905.1 hypothetical protein [Paenibacillus macerans]